MSNKLSIWLKKKLLGKERNLISLDDPFLVMKDLLQNNKVTGVLDAGASNGRISRILLKNFPGASAYAFEPNPLYQKTLETYANNDTRFHPQYLALSDCEGDANLFITESPGNTSLLSPTSQLREIDSTGATIKEQKRVKLVTIDQWAKRNNNVDIQIMKFDIQGVELKALQGAIEVLQKSTCAVYAEILFNYLYSEGALFSEIDLFFREQGFVLYDIYKPKYSKSGQIMWANTLYIDPKKVTLS